jgi:hypothetical protein
MFVRPVYELVFAMLRPPDQYSYSYLLGLSAALSARSKAA